MPTINRAFKEISCKIVYYGCGLCGKTTNLQIVHRQIPSKFRGDLVSLATEQDRTLFFDFLPLDLGEVKGFKTKFQLYTVPGQVFYNATRKLVLRGVDGIVFVADSHPDRYEDNVESLDNLQENLREYGLDLDQVPVVLQYNKRDLPSAMSLDQLQKSLNSDGRWQYVEAVAVEGTGVKETLKAVSSQVLSRLNESVTARGAGEARVSKLAEAAARRREATSTPTGSGDAGESARGGVSAAAPSIARGGEGGGGGPVIPKSATSTGMPAAGAAAAGAGGGVPGAGSSLTVIQQGKVRWRGLPIGSTHLELTHRSNVDGRGDYQLKGVVKSFFSRRYWFKMMERAEPEAPSRPQADGCLYFRECADSKDKNPRVEAWITVQEPKLLFVRETDGSREYVPAQHTLREILG